LIHTGNNSAGSGGNGYVTGSLLDSSNVAFEPLNVAEGQANATADAYQANIGYFDQAAIQVTGVGGDGGNQNIAMGGSVGGRGSSGTETIGTGDNSAGNGGDGHFSGAMLHAAAAVYNPINMAVAS